MLKPTSLVHHDCVLKPDRIDIWLYSLHADIPHAGILLSPDEQIRAQRFHFQRHQRRFTNARAGLRLILARYLQEPPTTFVFTLGKQGKPALMNTQELEFNLSHSGDIAMLAIGQRYPMGIDIEYFSARPFDGIGKQLFSPREYHAFKKIQPPLSALDFVNIWVQKEALIKACGLGLSYPTQTFDVPILSQAAQTIVDTLHQRTWTMQTFMPYVACCAALCHDKAVQTIRYLPIPHETLFGLSL